MADKVVVVQVGQLAVITNPATGHVITMGQLGPRGPIGPAGVGSLSLSDDPPLMNGTASPGTSEAASRGDHRHPTDTSRASASALTTLTGVVNGHTSQIATNIADIEQLQTDVSDVTAQVVTNTSAIAGKVDEAPEDGALYGRKDGAWAGIPDPGAGGGSTPSATMQWKADATSGDPGYGRFGTDTGVVSTATTLHISARSKNAIDISGFLQNLRAGATVYAYELRNTVNWAIFDVTADAVDQSDYYTVAVTPRAAEGAEPGDYADIGAFFSFGSVGGGGGSVDWGDIGGTLSAQTDLQAALDAKLDASAVSSFGLTLIDDANASVARTTLGLGSAATTASSAYATAAQGATADTAVQPGDLAAIATTGDVGDLTGLPGGTTNFLRADGTFAAPPGGTTYPNLLINGAFNINQRQKSGTVTLTSGQYGHDRWKAGASGCTYTFSSSGGITTITISAGSLMQVVEGKNVRSGTHVLSWAGTAQGKFSGGSYGASGVTGSLTGGSNATVEFNTGTLTQVQLTTGSTAQPFIDIGDSAELFRCQRYCFRFNLVGSITTLFLSSAIWGGGTNGFVFGNFPQVMYASPTLVVEGAASNYTIYDVFATSYSTCTAISSNPVTNAGYYLFNFSVTSGGTGARNCFFSTNSQNTNSLRFEAEL